MMKSLRICSLLLALFISLSFGDGDSSSGSMEDEGGDSWSEEDSMEEISEEMSGESLSMSTEEEEENRQTTIIIIARNVLKKCKKKGMTPTEAEELETFQGVRKAKKCLINCKKSEECLAWRFSKADQTCELFSSFGTLEVNDMYTSGTKECMNVVAKEEEGKEENTSTEEEETERKLNPKILLN